jgi:hypothetical protein
MVQAVTTPGAETELVTEAPHRRADIDNLKVVLVAAVIVAHTTIAWTGIGTWVFHEPPVREPLLSILSLSLIGALFGMSFFFLIAGMFTAPSLARKGTRKFLIDRAIRLGLPMLFFIIFLSPMIEYVDPDNAYWDQGFWAFTLEIWWPPAPGPTWFLGVLLLFSVVYALARSVRPARAAGAAPLRIRDLLLVAMVVTLASYALRLSVPLGEELWRLGLPQAPAWIAGFTLGVIGAERGWYAPIAPRIVAFARRAGTAALVAGVLALASTAFGLEFGRLTGGWTWESFLFAAIEGVLIVTMPLWLIDLFRRRFSRQGPLAEAMSRSAFAAFLFHQLVLVGLVLVSRYVPWAPEVEYALVTALGVAGSFALGWLVLKIPGVTRVI